MVLVNGQKFACESCVKGHRSSSCSHTGRPLFEIKRKGRPVSQCEQCRKLRQSRKLHSKCVCNDLPAAETQSSSGDPHVAATVSSHGDKKRRFKALAPTLPNGLKDLTSASPAGPSNPRQRVDSLLNPCVCGDQRDCRCYGLPSHYSDASSGSRLDALAQAAVLCSRKENSNSSVIPPHPKRTSTPPATQVPKRSCCQPSPPVHRLELPPLHLTSDSDSAALPSTSLRPSFTTIPSISTMTSLAGTGCTCGFECSCPGCVEHRGKQHASGSSASDCSDGPCENCVDRVLDTRLNSDAAGGAQSSLDRFFAQAATLPLPPRQRLSSARLDPRNVTLYPVDLFAASAEEYKRSKAFGLILVPKLECCGGQCGCPEGSCSCDHECGGNCSRHAHARRSASVAPRMGPVEPASPVASSSTTEPVASSCCC